MCKHCKRDDCPDVFNDYWCTVHKESSISRPGKSRKVVGFEESYRLVTAEDVEKYPDMISGTTMLVIRRLFK